MPVVNIVGGALLLTLGRKIFWLFVAISGFFAGYELASRYLSTTPEWVTLAIAFAVGLVSAILAVFLQKVVIGVAGFFAGVFIASRLVSQFGEKVKDWDWLILIIGGIIGLLLVAFIFEWALILLSSLAGSLLIVEGLQLVGLVGMVVGVVLFLIGSIFQSGFNRQDRSNKRATI